MDPYQLSNDNRYDNMTYRRCGRSGLKLPIVSLGLWHNFGHVDDKAIAREICLRAFDAGMTHFDLANNYGPPPGSAEETFGEILKSDLAKHRDEIIISTKAGYLMWPGPYGEWGSRKHLLASLDQSLKRMGVDYVDIFYSHRPDPDSLVEETMGALDSAVKQGKALYAGISSYSADQTAAAATCLHNMGTPCLIHQPRYSMFDRWIEDGVLTQLEKHGIGCIVFSPLAQGLLTDRYLDGIPADSRAAKAHGFLREEQVTPEAVEMACKLAKIAQNRNQSVAQMALAWCLRNPLITSVLMGVSSVPQLEQNLATMQNLDFTQDELDAIERILAGGA